MGSISQKIQKWRKNLSTHTLVFVPLCLIDLHSTPFKLEDGKQPDMDINWAIKLLHHSWLKQKVLFYKNLGADVKLLSSMTLQIGVTKFGVTKFGVSKFGVTSGCKSSYLGFISYRPRSKTNFSGSIAIIVLYQIWNQNNANTGEFGMILSHNSKKWGRKFKTDSY